ncbi:MAG: cytochrome c peroxidase [Woeseiaceae bacterium]|nr:cytochrome c peroxidase [Woeseiaceae bacterium]
MWQWLTPPTPWDEAELGAIASLSIDALPPLPPDPTNAVADDLAAAEFGHALFFEPRLSDNGMISCSTCHQPIRYFTDGLPRGVALGMSKRNTPTIVGSAYSPWMYWDGRRDSQWSQALAPLEDPNEHGTSRMRVLSLVASEPAYRERYEALFGGPPSLLEPAEIDRAFANIGKAIAAYERLLMPGRSKFDDYAAHLAAGGDYREQAYLDDDELHGLRLFMGKGRCTECHNGPLFTNNEFHNTGLLSLPGELPDRGRSDGRRLVEADPFNCLGAFNDDPGRACPELRYVRTGVELIGATRTPSLRNIAHTAPYQSKGQHATLAEVIQHYDVAPLAMIGHNEAEPLGLKPWERDRIEAFLDTLSAPPATDPGWLQAPPAERWRR